jgi:hypothetical protein
MGDETANVAVDASGDITILIGTQSTGQGHHTAYAQIVAEQFGVAPERVHIIQGDTAKVATGLGTGGSASIPTGGVSVQRATKQLGINLKELAADALETSVADLEIDGGVVRIAGTDRSVSFADLAKPGIGIVTPNPGSSGSARWNILAAYQEQIANGASEADAEAYLKKVFANVKALPGSGRDATTAFQGGTGDVLLSYENEAIFARQQGEDIDYVIPKKNLLIQNPGAVTTKAPAAAKKFLAFGESAAGQKICAQYGFRPVEGVSGVDVGEVKGANDPSAPFPAIDDLATIDKTFGGWEATNKKFFDENDGIITKIIAASGKS